MLRQVLQVPSAPAARSPRASIFALAVLAAGCIDASQRMAQCPAPAGATALDTCAGGVRAADDGTIDDFEDGDTQVKKLDGREGHWFTAHDDAGSTIGPSPLAAARGDGGGNVLHVTGLTSTADGAWGSQLGANFVDGSMYDASKYAGISFKAKVGEGSTKKVRFKVGDVNTTPDGAVCKSCWNHFGKDLTLTTDWKEYEITFAEMRQETGWGDHYAAVTPSKLFSINWSWKPGQSFDLWLDDVQFFECR